MNAAELVAKLEAGQIPPVTVFHGDESWFGEEGIRVVRRHFLGEDEEGYLSLLAPRGLNDREGTRIVDAVDEARTVPMFGGRKVVAWRGRSLDEEDVRALAELAASAPAFVRFVLLLATLGKGAEKKLSAAGAAVGDGRRLFDTPWPGKPEYQTPLNQWAVARARRHGLTLPIVLAHVLTGAVGNDLAGIDAALTKLSLLAGAGREVAEEDISALTGGGRDFDAFALGEAVYARDAAKAFRVVRSAFLEGVEDQGGRRTRNPGAIAARLLWSLGFTLDKVYAASRLLGEGVGPDEAASRLSRGRRSPVVQRTVGYARTFTPAELQRHYLLIEAAEAETRSVVPEEVVLERLVGEMTEKADG